MFKKYIVFCLFIISSQLLVAQNNNIKQDSIENVFTKVEQEAYFPGGAEKWKKYLQKNLKINVPIKNKAPNGIYPVVVKFIVSKDGTITNIIPESNYGFGMEEEVIRILKKGPNWIPAQQNGKIVNAYRRQPITFVISN